MLNVGFIGWRGMVGSVLMDRMRAERDFDGIDPTFYSTSDAGGRGPELGGHAGVLGDAFDLATLSKHAVLLSCQGGGYTSDVYPRLRAEGWDGYWIDAASALRMDDSSVIILDPVNRKVIDDALARGGKTYCGANCTVSLMLMALHGLFEADLVRWVSSMTYQAASGAGAKHMRELVAQMAAIGDDARVCLDDPATSALDIDARVADLVRSPALPTEQFGVPLAASLIPWIDKEVELGQSREEWKGHVEANKILGAGEPVTVDGICVRVGAMRCHAQGLTVELKADVPIDEIADRLARANEWVRVVPNTKDDSVRSLSPVAVGGTLEVPIGRVRKMRMGDRYLSAFTVGDQLLWGAAEPLRRMLRILREHLDS